MIERTRTVPRSSRETGAVEMMRQRIIRKGAIVNKKRALKSVDRNKLVHVVGGDNTEPLPWDPQLPGLPVKGKNQQ